LQVKYSVRYINIKIPFQTLFRKETSKIFCNVKLSFKIPFQTILKRRNV
jgi:hypothetical protein